MSTEREKINTALISNILATLNISNHLLLQGLTLSPAHRKVLEDKLAELSDKSISLVNRSHKIED